MSYMSTLIVCNILGVLTYTLILYVIRVYLFMTIQEMMIIDFYEDKINDLEETIGILEQDNMILDEEILHMREDLVF